MAVCKNKTHQCKFYLTAKQTGDQPSCTDDGDITNPELDIYCGEIDGDDIVEWIRKIICEASSPCNSKCDSVI